MWPIFDGMNTAGRQMSRKGGKSRQNLRIRQNLWYDLERSCNDKHCPESGLTFILFTFLAELLHFSVFVDLFKNIWGSNVIVICPSL
jgi:hypothetical protein